MSHWAVSKAVAGRMAIFINGWELGSNQIRFLEPNIIKHNNVGCAVVLIDSLEKIEKSLAIVGTLDHLILVQPARPRSATMEYVWEQTAAQCATPSLDPFLTHPCLDLSKEMSGIHSLGSLSPIK
ncbi:hypothetical protein DSO57_1016236 [Entomophthora muscae]|uniref:Uncharacterized protein n=1 Tax=Entomophthora muscae TaxID=34485 RepID=A0ACC2S6Y4_9FUNG|nr:hypothetical protein DSO57_1016236 [Entomophthora muscae]